jgi:hypothetical protein
MSGFDFSQSSVLSASCIVHNCEVRIVKERVGYAHLGFYSRDAGHAGKPEDAATVNRFQLRKLRKRESMRPSAKQQVHQEVDSD